MNQKFDWNFIAESLPIYYVHLAVVEVKFLGHFFEDTFVDELSDS